MYVTDTAQPKLLQVVETLMRTVSPASAYSFGYPGTPVAITPPPASEIITGGY